ncbi:NAD-dependent epimerase/dehydratase family protein [Sphingomonas hengshuiensis]|uniref:NAD-dependent epimerase/dehydratase domain-containing protein n=1 Tax=Sphingomonas hengshuiensis TaxID=1609977 RepID=A0A7U5BGE8_9SPHN|nr:NAD-dependent epimerase/dehydratase family protein [Sphingomonas hengshuiensis]AJP74786.1 hypothetical protein TS85_23690 [Sphingomonas hengshuiensis]
MTRRALVTGITGFIGGALSKRLLAEGWRVDAIVRPQSNTDCLPFARDVNFHIVEDGQDLTPVFAESRPDSVFHLASLYLAEHRPDQIGALVQSNILFPTLLAEAMAATGSRCLINTGTAWQNFQGKDYHPVNLYSATKQATEDLLLYYASARDLSVVTLRLFDTYGRGDKRRKLLQILIDSAKSGDPIDMSPGEQIVDMTHIDDVVDAFLLAAEHQLAQQRTLSETYYVSNERQSVRALASLVSETLGRPIEANFGGRPYRAREVMHPFSPQSEDLVPGWCAKRRLSDQILRLSQGAD